jgi:hypothetical protein
MITDFHRWRFALSLSTDILKANILKENEFCPRSQQSLLTGEPSVSHPKGLEFPKAAELVYPQLNSDFEYGYSGDMIVESRKIVVDPLAFYVPYHFDPTNWGIYFRVNSIKRDFDCFQRGVRLNKSVCFAAYVRMIYFHELCHHCIEDVATIRESYSKTVYPFLSRNEEEGLCEYLAFKQQVRANHPFNIPSVLMQANWMSYTFHGARDEAIYNEHFVRALFHHWKRGSDRIYRPMIHKGVGMKIGPLWHSFWQAHKAESNVINVPFSRTRKTCEIYNRIFSTSH